MAQVRWTESALASPTVRHHSFSPAIGDVAYSLIYQAIMFLGIAASVFLSFRYVIGVTQW